jgi:hypothetical protein
MYPLRYTPLTDFVRNEQSGNEISAAAVQAELSRISECASQIITLLKRTHTSDGKLKLDQAVRLNDVITDQDLGIGNGVQTVFNFLQPIDAAVDLVRVFANGVITTPLSITDTSVTFAVAPAGGVAITCKIYTNLAGVIDRLQSVVQDEGASMIGIADLAANFTGADVESALAELATTLTNLETALGDVAGFVLRDGTRPLTGQWELNERSGVTVSPAAAVGSMVIAVPSEASVLTLSDGALTLNFEFDTDSSVGITHIPVAIGATPADTAANLVTAINASPLAVQAEAAGPNVTLTHEIPYALGNQPIGFSGSGVSSLVGMAGGVDGLFSGAMYRTHFRIRNCPPSLREGDVVVHQQLATVLAQVTSALQAFLRLDGSNEMVNDLDLGGNQVIDMAPGTADAHGATLGQVEDLIEAAQPGKLSVNGLKDTAPEGTLTGPVTLGQTATATADVDQTTTPGSVAVHTLSGVPKPGANDHAVNKKYVDDAIAAALPVAGTGLPDFDLEGDGLPAGPIVSLNSGGEFYFEDLTIAAGQNLTIPTRIFCEGNFNLQNTASITSTAPIELVVTGTVTIAAAITCPHLSIRAGGAVSITAAITAHTDGTHHRAYPAWLDKPYGGPSGVYSPAPERIARWRAIIIDTLSTMSITAALTADDIFLKAVGTITVTSTLRAFWFLHSSINTETSGDGVGWNDGFRDYAVLSNATGSGPGAAGGTAGGAGTSANGAAAAAPASIYQGSNRPYLFPTYRLARGSFGCRNGTYTPAGDALRGRGGGRISIYSGANLVLTGALLNVKGGDADDIGGGANDGGGGGGGSARAVAAGTITDGTINANGGDTVDNNSSGGGGLAAFVASAFSGTQTTTAVGPDGATDGTTVAAALTSAQIQALEQRGIFEVFPDAA